MSCSLMGNPLQSTLCVRVRVRPGGELSILKTEVDASILVAIAYFSNQSHQSCADEVQTVADFLRGCQEVYAEDAQHALRLCSIYAEYEDDIEDLHRSIHRSNRITWDDAFRQALIEFAYDHFGPEQFKAGALSIRRPPERSPLSSGSACASDPAAFAF